MCHFFLVNQKEMVNQKRIGFTKKKKDEVKNQKQNEQNISWRYFAWLQASYIPFSAISWKRVLLIIVQIYIYISIYLYIYIYVCIYYIDKCLFVIFHDSVCLKCVETNNMLYQLHAFMHFYFSYPGYCACSAIIYHHWKWSLLLFIFCLCKCHIRAGLVAFCSLRGVTGLRVEKVLYVRHLKVWIYRVIQVWSMCFIYAHVGR